MGFDIADRTDRGGNGFPESDGGSASGFVQSLNKDAVISGILSIVITGQDLVIPSLIQAELNFGSIQPPVSGKLSLLGVVESDLRVQGF